jgi:hypothetical protein
MTIRTTSTSGGLVLTLNEAPAHAQCNFHRDRAATHSYAGTPVCAECSARMMPGPD